MHHLMTMAPQEVNGQSRVLHKRLVQDFLLDFQRRRHPNPCWIDCRMSAQGPLRRIGLFLVTQGNENEGLSSSSFPHITISYVCKGCYIIKRSVVKDRVAADRTWYSLLLATKSTLMATTDCASWNCNNFTQIYIVWVLTGSHDGVFTRQAQGLVLVMCR